MIENLDIIKTEIINLKAQSIYLFKILNGEVYDINKSCINLHVDEIAKDDEARRQAWIDSRREAENIRIEINEQYDYEYLKRLKINLITEINLIHEQLFDVFCEVNI